MVDRLVNSKANARRIAIVESCFGASGQPLAIPGRVLVGEGVLTKMCRKKAKPRQFFLFNDILVYGYILMDKKKYIKQHIIPLEEVKLENLEDDGVLKNGWLIRTPTKSFAVYSATATEKTEWMAHINKCVDDLLKKTGKKPSLEHAAVWIPDAEASICMHCRKTQFTVLNRRHHCRKCGAVVCNPCSSKKFLLPAQSSKPLRVCLSCYATLNKVTAYLSDGQVKHAEKTTALLKKIEQDSSGEDDSEDENDNEEGGKHDLAQDLENLSIGEKPTFYGDTAESLVENNNAVEDTSNVGCHDNEVTSGVDSSTTNIIADCGDSNTAGYSASSTTDYSTSSTADYSTSSTADYSTSCAADNSSSTADSTTYGGE